MNKFFVFGILIFFFVYTIVFSTGIIPNKVNNFLMFLVAIGAIYFIVFRTDFRTSLRDHLKTKDEEKNLEKNNN